MLSTVYWEVKWCFQLFTEKLNIHLETFCNNYARRAHLKVLFWFSERQFGSNETWAHGGSVGAGTGKAGTGKAGTVKAAVGNANQVTYNSNLVEIFEFLFVLLFLLAVINIFVSCSNSWLWLRTSFEPSPWQPDYLAYISCLHISVKFWHRINS